jgi:hypothetical protein
MRARVSGYRRRATAAKLQQARRVRPWEVAEFGRRITHGVCAPSPPILQFAFFGEKVARWATRLDQKHEEPGPGAIQLVLGSAATCPSCATEFDGMRLFEALLAHAQEDDALDCVAVEDVTPQSEV